MTEGIAETVSINRRRGRPRVFDHPAADHARAELRRDHPDILDRTLQNHLYQYTAQALLDGQDWARWLYDPAGIAQGKRGAYRQTIMQELGRIEGNADLVATAKLICELKPTAREAVRMIRAARRGHKPQGTADHLADRIMALVNDYLRHHAGVDRDVLLGALQLVEDAVWGMKALHRPPSQGRNTDGTDHDPRA
jgi:hypothetical protein